MVRGVVVAAVVAVGGAVWASPVQLETSGDACDLGELEHQLAQLVGSDPISVSAAAKVIVATGTDGAAVVAHITFDDGNGERRGPRVVRAKTCVELVAATAVVIAMGLPDVTPTVEPSPPAVDAPVASDPVIEEPARDLHEVRLAQAPREISAPLERQETAVILGGAGVTTPTQVDEQLIVGIRWRHGDRSLAAELSTDAPEQRQVSIVGQIRVVRAAVSLAPCLHAGAFAGCALVSLGTIAGSGIALDAGRSAFAPLVSGGVRLTWEHDVTARFAVRLHVDLSGLATTTRFDVDHMTVWESPRFEGAAGIGMLTRFP